MAFLTEEEKQRLQEQARLRGGGAAPQMPQSTVDTFAQKAEMVGAVPQMPPSTVRAFEQKAAPPMPELVPPPAPEPEPPADIYEAQRQKAMADAAAAEKETGLQEDVRAREIEQQRALEKIRKREQKQVDFIIKDIEDTRAQMYGKDLDGDGKYDKEGEVAPWSPKRMGWGQRIGLAISAAMMSYSSALAGKDPAAGVKMIDSIVRRHNKEQMDEWTRMGGRIKGGYNQLSALYAVTGRKELAAQASYVADLGVVKGEIANQMAKEKDGQKKANLQVLLKGIDQKEKTAKDEEKLMWEKNVRDNRKTQLGEDKLTWDIMKFGMQQKAKAAEKGKDKGKTLPAEALTKLADMQSMSESARNLKDMFTDKTGKLSFVAQFNPWSDAASYEAWRGEFAERLLRAKSGAQINEQEYKRLMKLVPASYTVVAKSGAKFKALIDGLESIVNNRLSVYKKAGYDVSQFDIGPTGAEEDEKEKRLQRLKSQYQKKPKQQTTERPKPLFDPASEFGSH